ncbi:type I restriction endonuclease subunit R [Brevibacterium linens]|uniref:type I restriction endonuclease subunit R n=1 Tax=Brevibacterium linens TaxID=1703 RepID=UPI000FCC545D|nr:type I restriction endonuclease subunit R [Brevibacterium linens]AZT99553.1 DEAD/DEAH box helicase [Brevibacterium linens]
MIPESEWETFHIDRLVENGWEHVPGPEVIPGQTDGRTEWDGLVLKTRAAQALRTLNPGVPPRYLDEALGEILAAASADPIAENFRFHGYLTHGYRGISYIDADGTEQNPTIRLFSHRPEDNSYLAINQVTIRNREIERRFDIVLYVNGFPLVIMEIKRAGDANTGEREAYAQLQTYLREFPDAFSCCPLTVVSDGVNAKYGTPFTPFNHYSPWNVDDDGAVVALGRDHTDTGASLGSEVLIDGVFNQERFGQIIRNFVAFDEGADGLAKRVAKPHQYFAVTKAVGTTVEAVRSDGRAGVVWHTQGSGKSMEMELYAHLVAIRPELKNPTIVVVTDRTELDSQLFETFDRSQLLAENPVKISSRRELREALTHKATGGIYFSTLQKFGRTDSERADGLDHPELSNRRNIIVIVDEAHRSHYDELDGFARHIRDALPRASFIAFTGTPISFADRNTQEVFGDVIDTYDLSRAVSDGATVPVVYEPRLIEMGLGQEVSEDDLNTSADEATAGLDDVERTRVEQSVAVINSVYGNHERLQLLAADIVEHWEQRSESMRPFIAAPGKAMIVCATREICARLYEEIIELRPDWHSDDVDAGKIKVVYSSNSSDSGLIAKHRRRQGQNKTIQKRIKDVDDELELVIVKDMMLTGFDAPQLHTLYLDRPLKNALLMQTLARVNRTYRGKADGLMVAYAPIANNLRNALAEYTARDQETEPMGRKFDEAVRVVHEFLDALDTLCAGYDWRAKLDGKPGSHIKAALGLTNYLRDPAHADVTLAQQPRGLGDDGTENSSATDAPEGSGLADNYRRLSGSLARAWALARGSDELKDRRADAQFYEEVRVWMAKFDAQERQASGRPVSEDVELMLAGLLEESTHAGEIVDIYEAAGLAKPSLQDLTPDLTHQAQKSPTPHLAIEALRDVLTDRATQLTKSNLVRQKAFAERIRELMNRYTNQQLTSAEVIAELVELAREVADEGNRGQQFDPPLDWKELAFYDAVAENESAVQNQGADTLAQIARELVGIMQRDVKTDWTVRDDVRAKLRTSVKLLLIRHKYPPDRRKEAIQLVIDQMEELAKVQAA